MMIPIMLAAGCTTSERNEWRSTEISSSPEALSVDDLRERAANLRNMAEQFDQEAAAFRNEIPGGQPVLQRKAVVSEELRERAVALEQRAGALAAQKALASGSPSMGQQGAVNTRFQHRRLAQELHHMATLRREEAARLAQRADADPTVISEKRQLADRLDAIAREADQKALDEERKIPHGMVPQ
jgi:hypothetical protein